MNNDDVKGTPEPQKLIVCKCGCPMFETTKVHQLAPGDDSGPIILKGIRAWRCASCGDLHMPNRFPKKGDDEQAPPGALREAPSGRKLILPDNAKKLTIVN